MKNLLKCILILLICGSAFGVNNFTDGIALWSLDNNGNDSINSNTLAYNFGFSSGDKKEGTHSADNTGFLRGIINDGDLGSEIMWSNTNYVGSNYSFTFCFWGKLDAVTGADYFVVKGWTSEFTTQMGCYAASGGISFFKGEADGAGIDTTITVSDANQINTWYHVVCRYDDTSSPNGVVSLRIHDESTLVGTASSAVLEAWNTTDTSELVFMNSRFSTAPINGHMDEAITFNRVLTDEEADQVWTQTYNGPMATGGGIPCAGSNF